MVLFVKFVELLTRYYIKIEKNYLFLFVLFLKPFAIFKKLVFIKGIYYVYV